MKNLTTILLVAWTLMMAWLLLSPRSPEVTRYFFQGEDKVAHFILFLVWCFLLTLRGLYGSIKDYNILLIVFVISVIIAAGTEILQGMIPYRSRDLMDFVADMIGVIVGMIAAIFFRKYLVKA